jgi:hypothetical protein
VLEEAKVPSARRRLLQAFSEAMADQRDAARATAAGIPADADLDAEERRLLELALGEPAGMPRPASMRGDGPVVLAMRMALIAQEARLLLQAGTHAAAAQSFSELLLLELDAPWASSRALLAAWSEGLHQAQENHRWNPRGEWPSVTMEVQPGDHLTGIRKRFLESRPGELICTGLIARANRIEGFIHPGDVLRVPTDPVSVIVDLDSRWTLYLHADEVVAAWEVGIGRPGEETITGDFIAGTKDENPMWSKIGQEPIPFGDPRNPLGTRWIGWNQGERTTSYGFHGTKEPESIGKAASDGCIRLHNEDVEELFEILPVGAPIHVRH